MDQEKIQATYEPLPGGGGIGKIILYHFYENEAGDSSEKDIRNAIEQFRKQGELTGLILDLRENPGGFLSQAVKVAGLFISNGVVVISKYGKGEVHYLRSVSGRSFFNGPLVILTSKMSASAAEIVAQTLQDYGVALVVGDEHTFGKGSIQYQTVTDPRSDFFFKVTVGRYYTVSGKSTQIDGVLADIVVPSSYAPYKIGERFLDYPLSPDHVSPAFVDPLTDLDAKVRHLFQVKYLPYLQRVIPFWRRMLPILQENSRQRISRNPEFQALFKKQDKVRARMDGMSVNSVDEAMPQMGMSDMQMQEATNILNDMLRLEKQSKAD
jgi:carboxyl-terminal processing protease